MNSSRLSALLLSLTLTTTALAQQGQMSEPHVGYIYPAGGRRGTTFEATIGGRYLNANSVHISGAGVKATITNQERQVTPTEQSQLRETLSKIQEKRKQGQSVTPEETKMAEEIRLKLNKFGRRLTNPSLGEFVTLQITVAPNAPHGNREIRLETPAGLSNPLVFQVGELPEVSKKDWRNIPKSRDSMDPELDPKPPEKDIRLPVTLNGQIPPGGLDRYRFSARKGQQLVVVVRARELIPYISDAVPGWFRAAVALTDASGKELAYTDDFQFRPDPVLYYKVPADGIYVLQIKDALYRGREDFVYRVTLGELPFLTAIFPLGGRAGTQTTVGVGGWNLPFNQLPLDLRNSAPGVYPISRAGVANNAPFAVDTLPECFEKEPNNDAAHAQPVALPVIINGRIDQPGDLDVFRFEGKAGDQIVAEVYARRLDSPLDLMLIVTDAAGKQIAFNDDHEDKSSALNTHHADSYLALALPATGSYFVHLGDTQQAGGATYSYRVRLSAPRPDFELRVTPSALNVHGGASVPLTVHALRKDGFSGPIALRLKDAPKGFTLTAAEIPEKQDKARFTLNASPESKMEPFSVTIEGRAIVSGREVVRVAMPADDMTQSFAYRHLVPAQDLKVAVTGRFRPGDAARVLTATPLRIPAGGTAELRAFMPVGPVITKVEYELSEPPDGITIKSATSTRGNGEIVLQTDAAKIKPGTKGNLIISVFAQAPTAAGKGDGGAPRRIPFGALPAIPFEIVPAR
jgi:hypothetical protein